MQGFNLRVEWKWLIDSLMNALFLCQWAPSVKRDPGARDWCEQFPKVSFYSRWLDYDTDE